MIGSWGDLLVEPLETNWFALQSMSQIVRFFFFVCKCFLSCIIVIIVLVWFVLWWPHDITYFCFHFWLDLSLSKLDGFLNMHSAGNSAPIALEHRSRISCCAQIPRMPGRNQTLLLKKWPFPYPLTTRCCWKPMSHSVMPCSQPVGDSWLWSRGHQEQAVMGKRRV